MARGLCPTPGPSGSGARLAAGLWAGNAVLGSGAFLRLEPVQRGPSATADASAQPGSRHRRLASASVCRLVALFFTRKLQLWRLTLIL